jgi:hypothetical protein
LRLGGFVGRPYPEGRKAAGTEARPTDARRAEQEFRREKADKFQEMIASVMLQKYL